jgi:hypothetical protein
MSTFCKKYESRPDNILVLHARKRRAIELARSFVDSLVNQLAVIVGRRDLRSDDLKQGSQSAKRVVAIQGPRDSQELNEIPIETLEVCPNRRNAKT